MHSTRWIHRLLTLLDNKYTILSHRPLSMLVLESSSSRCKMRRKYMSRFPVDASLTSASSKLSKRCGSYFAMERRLRQQRHSQRPPVPILRLERTEGRRQCRFMASHEWMSHWHGSRHCLACYVVGNIAFEACHPLISRV